MEQGGMFTSTEKGGASFRILDLRSAARRDSRSIAIAMSWWRCSRTSPTTIASGKPSPRPGRRSCDCSTNKRRFSPPKKKDSLAAVLFHCELRGFLRQSDVGRLQALRALDDVELHRRTFREAAE